MKDSVSEDGKSEHPVDNLIVDNGSEDDGIRGVGLFVITDLYYAIGGKGVEGALLKPNSLRVGLIIHSRKPVQFDPSGFKP